MNGNQLIYNCHSLHEIMTEPRGKSPEELYADAKANLEKLSIEYNAIANKQTKRAQNILKKIRETNTEILMYEQQRHRVRLSDTCIKRIIKTYASNVRGRREILSNKYIDKGLQREQTAITLLSSVLFKVYRKNTMRLNNNWLTGEPDLFDGAGLVGCKETIDTKASFSYETFLQTFIDGLNSAYEYQGHGYMDLTGAEKHTVAYCLVNGTQKRIMDEKFNAAKQLEVLDPFNSDSSEYIAQCKQIERNHIFDIDEFAKENPGFDFHSEVKTIKGKSHWDFDIEPAKRINLFTFKRDESVINEIHKKVETCNQWAQEMLFKPNR